MNSNFCQTNDYNQNYKQYEHNNSNINNNQNYKQYQYNNSNINNNQYYAKNSLQDNQNFYQNKNCDNLGYQQRTNQYYNTTNNQVDLCFNHNRYGSEARSCFKPNSCPMAHLTAKRPQQGNFFPSFSQ